MKKVSKWQRDKQNQKSWQALGRGRPWPGGQLVAGLGSGSGWAQARECQRCQPEPGFPPPSQPPVRMPDSHIAKIAPGWPWRLSSSMQKRTLGPHFTSHGLQSSLWQFTVNCSNEGNHWICHPQKNTESSIHLHFSVECIWWFLIHV